jgi:hypothetical protein
MRTVDVGKLRSKSASPQPTGRIAIVLILSGNSIRSSKSYAPACFALTFVCPISFTIQLHGSNFLSMLLQSQTAPSRFREPNKWAASRPISPVLLKVFSRSEMMKSPLMKGLLLVLFLIPVNLFAWTNWELLIWMDARGPRPSSQGERGKEIRKRFWTQSHDRGPRENYRQFPNCCANGEGPRHCHLGAR